jgi:VanZ family protein
MKKILFWICFIGLNALALSPAPYLPPLDVLNWWDKAQHAIGFGTLAVLAVLAYPDVSKLRIGLLLVALGVLIEVLQHLGGYRFGDWQDAVADGVGVVLGLVLARGLLKFVTRPNLQ